jgi:hypothetical protein
MEESLKESFMQKLKNKKSNEMHEKLSTQIIKIFITNVMDLVVLVYPGKHQNNLYTMGQT